jgi:hypothetical protein
MKKTWIIVLVVVLALGVAGVGYAIWSQVLNINGTVSTAKFDVHFDTSTPPKGSPTGGATGTANINVSNILPYSFSVALVNGYPGFTGTCTYGITNASTIPVKITGFDYSLDGTNWVALVNGTTVILPTLISTPAATPATPATGTVSVSVTNTGSFATNDSIAAGAIIPGTLTFNVTGTSTSGVVAATTGAFTVRFTISQ